MLKSAEKTGTNEFTLKLSISAEAFEAAVNKAYHKNKTSINMPGFRKGKAPRALIEKAYGANVFYDDALEIAFPEVYEAALTEAGIDPVDNPFDFNIDSIGKEGAELTLKVTVKPEITIEGYKGLTAVKPSIEVTDEDVDKELDKKREAQARIIPVEDRAAAMGDTAVIDFEGFVDGVAFEGGKGEEYELELGSGSFIPGFEEQVAGHTINDEFDVNVTFPEDYAEELKGKEAVFKIKLHAIKAKELPELDDDFVADVSETCNTVDELKAEIRTTLEKSKESSAASTFENEIYDKLSDLVTAEIPAAMIDRSVDNMLQEFKYNVESQGIPFDTYLQYMGMDNEKVKETYRPRAEKDVKIELALEKIAELEGIEVSEEDIEAEFSAMAEKYKVDAETVKKAIAVDSVTKELKARKASAVVLDSAVAEGESAKKAAKKAPAKKTTKKAPAKAAAAEAATDANEAE